MHFILEDIFFETHMIDVRHNLLHFWCAMMVKDIEFEIDKYSYGRRNQVQFGLNELNENEQIVEVVPLKQFYGTHEEARKDGPLPNHNCGVLARYKDVFAN